MREAIESSVLDDMWVIAGRGDIIELSMQPVSAGRVQVNRRFANATGHGVSIEDTATEALTASVMSASLLYPFPDGPIRTGALPPRKQKWDPDLDDILGEEMSDLSTLDSELNALLLSGRVRAIRFSLCSDLHWSLEVSWAKGHTGPIHFAADRKHLEHALRKLLAHVDTVSQWSKPIGIVEAEEDDDLIG